MSISDNPFGLFGAATRSAALSNLQTNNPKLTEIDDFIESYHQYLLRESEPIVCARLLRSFHQAKPPTTEQYLKQFIKDFKNDTAFAETVKLYRQKLADYQLAKIEAAEASLGESEPISEVSRLTPEALDWQRLLETLKRCVNNRSTQKTLAWHPQHQENYYLAKLYVQWQRYQAKYGPPVLGTTFPDIIAAEITEERCQSVTAKHVDTLQDLRQHKIDYSPACFANRQAKLEAAKVNDLEEIKKHTLAFSGYVDEILVFIQQPTTHELQRVFKEAMLDIRHHQRATVSNQTIFKLKMHTRYRADELATFEKGDTIHEMEIFNTIFAHESTILSEAPESGMIVKLNR